MKGKEKRGKWTNERKRKMGKEEKEKKVKNE